jgi:hypothetical protein
MNVNCVSCGHSLDLRNAYDDYRGQIRCFICGALLDIKTQDGQVRSVELAPQPQFRAPVPAAGAR